MKYSAFLWMILVLVLMACSAPEDTAPSQATDGGMTSAPPLDANSVLTFDTPEGWIEETPTSSMRQAQYRLPAAEGDPADAEIAVFYFHGQGGSVQDNINRWVGQFSTAKGQPIAETETTKKEVNGIPVTLLQVDGTYQPSTGPMMMTKSEPMPDYRMMAAIAETGSGPWFFKLTGPRKTVEKWEDSFYKLVESLSFGQ